MLRSIKGLKGYSLLASDGEIGKVNDFFFDDVSWTIRYLVADTGGWLPGRRVLISPVALGRPDWGTQVLPVSLTRQQIENSPDIDTHKPVSRQHEIELSRQFNWPVYWGDPYGAPGALNMFPPPPAQTEGTIAHPEPTGDPHLQNVKEVLGYNIAAKDGAVGHLDDLIVDDATWIIRYLVVDTGKWLPDKKVLISSQWVEKTVWAEENIAVNLTRETIRSSPPFDPEAPVNREYEIALYDYYGRPKYWA